MIFSKKYKDIEPFSKESEAFGKEVCKYLSKKYGNDKNAYNRMFFFNPRFHIVGKWSERKRLQNRELDEYDTDQIEIVSTYDTVLTVDMANFYAMCKQLNISDKKEMFDKFEEYVTPYLEQLLHDSQAWEDSRFEIPEYIKAAFRKERGCEMTQDAVRTQMIFCEDNAQSYINRIRKIVETYQKNGLDPLTNKDVHDFFFDHTEEINGRTLCFEAKATEYLRDIKAYRKHAKTDQYVSDLPSDTLQSLYDLEQMLDNVPHHDPEEFDHVRFVGRTKDYEYGIGDEEICHITPATNPKVDPKPIIEEDEDEERY